MKVKPVIDYNMDVDASMVLIALRILPDMNKHLNSLLRKDTKYIWGSKSHIIRCALVYYMNNFPYAVEVLKSKKYKKVKT
jgi:hypothetical protein